MSNKFWLPVAGVQDRKAMRDFAIGFSILLCVFFMLILPWWFDNPIPLWPLFSGVVLISAGLLYPPSVYPVYRLWMILASILAWVNTRLIMLLAYFVMIFPMGVVLRSLGKLQYRHVKWPIKQGTQSYWIKRDNSPNAENLKEPF